MLNKKQVQDAIKRINNAVAQLSGTRQTHLQLVSDINLVQQCCMDSFDAEAGIKTNEKEPECQNQQVD